MTTAPAIGCPVAYSVTFPENELPEDKVNEPLNVVRLPELSATEPEKVWARYFETLGEAARSGLFDILAHPDLVKVWGGRVARPAGDGFRVVDAFSRIIRLGEGISSSGRISEAAIERAVAALSICRNKMKNKGVTRARLGLLTTRKVFEIHEVKK